MEWFYAVNEEQHGPVTDARFEELIRAGIITPATLVWNKDQTEWKPLSAVRSVPADAGSLPPVLTLAGTRCVECGHTYAQADMITLNNSWVCATCKPKFLQRMMEGGTMPSNAGMMWRKKSVIVLGRDTPFPDRCVRCNTPTNGYKLKRELSWHPPAYFVLAISPLIYIIVAMIVRKKAILHIGLCETHRAARKKTILIASLSAVLGLLLFVVAAAASNSASGWLVLIGFLLLIGGGIYGATAAGIISATKIDHNLVHFKGAGKPFLETLPEWTGPK